MVVNIMPLQTRNISWNGHHGFVLCIDACLSGNVTRLALFENVPVLVLMMNIDDEIH